MKSLQLLRLQQQFLKSLHSQPTPWLLEQILPAQGFGGCRDEVIGLYLSRAMARTVDPLHNIFSACRWLLGEENLAPLLERFYSFSPGEPLNGQQLAYEFIGFLAAQDDAELAPLLRSALPPGFRPRQAVVEMAMLDWRLLWAEMAPRRPSPGPQVLLHRLRERSHLWARPRIDRGVRLTLTGFDLTGLHQAIRTDAVVAVLPVLKDGPACFLIQAAPGERAGVSPIDAVRARILSGCDGTRTITALCHQETFFGHPEPETEAILCELVERGILVDLQTEITGLLG